MINSIFRRVQKSGIRGLCIGMLVLHRCGRPAKKILADWSPSSRTSLIDQSLK